MFAAGEKVLVFTHFAEWGVRARRAPHRAHRTRRSRCYHGGLSRTARDQLIEDFQSGEGPGALVLSLKAGGTGLNLTAASHVVLYDRWWNPAVEDQARDRAWRIGQTRTVICHRLVCPGTVDERVEEVVAGKRRIADLVLPKSSSLADLDSDQLRVALGIRPDAVLTEDLSRHESGPRATEVVGRAARRTPRGSASPQRDFWGDADAFAEPAALITPADDPTVMLRSLGSPPLPGRETVAVHYFAAVAEKAASLAVALAAASGLLDMDDDETSTRGLLRTGVTYAEDQSRNTHASSSAWSKSGWVDGPRSSRASRRSSRRPARSIYEPLADGDARPMSCSCALHSARFDDDHSTRGPTLVIEGKPQCHIVAVAEGAGSRSRRASAARSAARAPACPRPRPLRAIPVARLDDAHRRDRARRPPIDANVACYAGDDAARFASSAS